MDFKEFIATCPGISTSVPTSTLQGPRDGIESIQRGVYLPIIAFQKIINKEQGGRRQGQEARPSNPAVK